MGEYGNGPMLIGQIYDCSGKNSYGGRERSRYRVTTAEKH